MASGSWKTAVVVGASSGIGEALARQLAAAGCRVALVARRGAELERIAGEVRAQHGDDACIHRTHDVTDYESVPAVWRSLRDELTSVDLVLYVAGAMTLVGPSEYTFEKDHRMLAVNLLGAIAWLNEAALAMQTAGSGTIVGVSSVAGDRGRRLAPVYGASKAGLNTFLESLRNRLSQHGVRVVTVRPGFVDTPMTADLPLPERMTVSAATAARLILEAARKGKLNAYVPGRWRWIMLVIRSIPSFLFRRMSI